MLKNYFKIALRSLSRNRSSSIINIGGLAVGMTVAMLIALWVYDELSFNTYHKDYEKIGRMWAGGTDPETGSIDGSDAMMFPIGAVLKTNYKQYFKHVLMAWWIGDYTLSLGDKKITSKGEFIEAGAPDMLSLKMVEGTYAALNDPHSIMLARSTATAMFGKESAMGKQLKIDNRIDVIVTGVYEDMPKNNHFAQVKFFAPWAIWVASNQWIKDAENVWDNRSFNIYVQLLPGIDMEAANAGVKDLFRKTDLPTEYGTEIEKYKPYTQVLPMSKWYLFSELVNGKPAAGRITFVWLFSIVGLFVLLLACINFVNLSTARSEKRAKEVGVRKAIGSGKKALVFQFLSESFVVVLLAFFLSMLLLTASLPWFNDLADKAMSLLMSNPVTWLIVFLFISLTGLMAGLYPALYLSSFQPVKVLKGTLRLGRFAALPRKVLVVIQFAVSVVLIIGTVVVYQQVQHARNRPIGYDREGLVSLPLNDPNYKGKHEIIQEALLKTGAVTGSGLSSSPITEVWSMSGGFLWEGQDPKKDDGFGIFNVSHDFGKVAGFRFIAGRDFSKQFWTDSAGMILNESAAKYMGIKDIVGQTIREENSPRTWKVIGVVQDLIMGSPYEPTEPTIFFLDNKQETASFLNMRINPAMSATIAIPKIEAVIRKIVPSASFNYKFIDDEFALKFSQEQRIGKLAALFAVLAIFISCLGLFGLASFVAEQRTKEIGIRKVIGASVFNLWKLLSKDFVLLVVISCVVAMPIAYYYMQQWLLKYDYRTTINWWVFVLAIVGALLITLLTVSFQAIRAALANPVKSLRTE